MVSPGLALNELVSSETQNSIGRSRDRLVMRGDEDARSVVGDRSERRYDHLCTLFIERRCRLIHEQQLRIGGCCTRNGHPLLLTS
ncbi:hypothetical protein BCF74_1355 [Knoellia remsis]|uniref:Uncharacterized protein n=1 Tax=Knoellia remsis TaxID=407159 RepID=A0A2T0U0Z2_9MICO|nr:hypothetical protein BCF74_1355 [Knoellia remsis]